MLWPVLLAGSWLWTRQGLIKAEDMDFQTGLAEIEAAPYDDPPPRNWVARFWTWLVSLIILISSSVDGGLMG